MDGDILPGICVPGVPEPPADSYYLDQELKHQIQWECLAQYCWDHEIYLVCQIHDRRLLRLACMTPAQVYQV